MSRSGLRLLGAERGQSMVEFALALPVLLVIIIGVVQFALVYHARDVATTAVQEGARLAAAEGRHFWGDDVYERMGRDPEPGSPGLLGRRYAQVDDARVELAEAEGRLRQAELEEVARAVPVSFAGPGWRQDPLSGHLYYSAAWIDRP